MKYFKSFSLAMFCIVIVLLWNIPTGETANEPQGPYTDLAPMIQIFTEESAEAQIGINNNAAPLKGSLQTSEIEAHYLWSAKENLEISKVQFYSSAPGKAVIRIYSVDDAGKPDAILAEAIFHSNQNGWQGVAFEEKLTVNSGSSYFISYGHERDITNYLADEVSGEHLPFYWNDFFFDKVKDEKSPTVPELQRGKAFGNQVKIEWEPATDNYAIKGYVIFRDGVEVGFTDKHYFIDNIDISSFKELEETEEPINPIFNYSIQAVDFVNNRSPLSNDLEVKIQIESIDVKEQVLEEELDKELKDELNQAPEEELEQEKEDELNQAPDKELDQELEDGLDQAPEEELEQEKEDELNQAPDKELEQEKEDELSQAPEEELEQEKEDELNQAPEEELEQEKEGELNQASKEKLEQELKDELNRKPKTELDEELEVTEEGENDQKTEDLSSKENEEEQYNENNIEDINQEAYNEQLIAPEYLGQENQLNQTLNLYFKYNQNKAAIEDKRLINYFSYQNIVTNIIENTHFSDN